MATIASVFYFLQVLIASFYLAEESLKDVVYLILEYYPTSTGIRKEVKQVD